MPTVLVTGGAGFIGSVSAQTFLDDGWQVIVYDNLFRGHRSSVPEGARFVEGDIRDQVALDRLFAEHAIDAVLHCAALAYVGESFPLAPTYFDVNVGGTATLLAAMQQADVRRIVFSSSCTVYGLPQTLPITEDEPVKPAESPYGQSKQMCETMLDWTTRANDFSCATLRYFNAAGAWGRFGERHDPETHLIPLVIDAALGRRGTLQVYGDDYPTPDGTCIRDYIHIRDLARAHVMAARRLLSDPPGTRHVVNLGVGQGHSILDVIRTVEEVSGLFVPYEITAPRPGDAPELVAANTRAREVLGWEPHHSDLPRIVADAFHSRRVLA